MKERAVQFGSNKSLIGIVTSPAKEGRDLPAVILLNSGLLHRVGPNRLYVKICRSLAEKGFLCLRFDLAGIGDSKLPKDGSYDDETGVLTDIESAMDYLEHTRSAKNFILIGLCSGADNAFRAAGVDERIIGASLLEAFSFPTDSYFVDAYKKSLFSLKSWIRLLTGKSEVWGLIKSRLRFHTSATKQLTENLRVPPKEEVLAEFHAINGSRVALQFIYAAEGAGEYHFKHLLQDEIAQLAEPRKPQVNFIQNSDHMFTLLLHQNEVLQLIEEWVRRFDSKPATKREKVVDA